MTKTPAGVAAEIRAEMARQRRKQSDLAVVLGISPSYLSKKLSGQSPLLASDVESLAIELGVSIAYLYGEQVEAKAVSVSAA